MIGVKLVCHFFAQIFVGWGIILAVFTGIHLPPTRISCRNHWILLQQFLLFNFGSRLDMVGVVGSNPIPPNNTGPALRPVTGPSHTCAPSFPER